LILGLFYIFFTLPPLDVLFDTSELSTGPVYLILPADEALALSRFWANTSTSAPDDAAA
jgi:hypothetical protein